MAAPSVVVYKDAYTDTGTTATTRVLTQRTVATGDVVAVVFQDEFYSSDGGAGGYSGATLAQTAGTAVIGTVTKNRDAGSASHSGCVLWTFAVTTGGTLTLTVSFTKYDTPTSHFSTAWTYVATGCGGVGNTAMNTSGGTASLATSDSSYVIALAADWNATGGATTTLTPAGAATPLDAHETDGTADQSGNGSKFSSRGGHWASVSAGTVAYGVSAPSSTAYNVVACELLASGGGGPATANAGVAAATGAAPSQIAGASTGWLYAGAASGTGWADTANAVGSGTGDYATWTDSGTGTSATLELSSFSAQAGVPAGSTVEAVVLKIRHSESPASAVASVTAQAYVGSTPHGSPVALTVSETVREDQVPVTGLAYADLADLRVRVTATRN